MTKDLYESNESFIVTNLLRALVSQLTPEQKSKVVSEVQQTFTNIKNHESQTAETIEWTKNLANHMLQADVK